MIFFYCFLMMFLLSGCEERNNQPHFAPKNKVIHENYKSSKKEIYPQKDLNEIREKLKNIQGKLDVLNEIDQGFRQENGN